MNNSELRDTIEFLGINIGGIGLSLTDLDAVLRTFILIATLVYSIQKIMYYNKKKIITLKLLAKFLAQFASDSVPYN